MKPTASSLTDWTKPGLARVTSTPAFDAASTSMLRMSTAQRTIARRFGRLANTSAGAAVSRSATIRSAVARGRDQACRVKRNLGLVQQHLAGLPQACSALSP